MSNPYGGMTSTTRASGRGHSSPSSTDSSLEARVGRQIEPQRNGCWLWTAGKANGYAMHGEAHRVHRFVYETLVGPIPEDHVLHHECETKDCCNPAHLKPMLPGDHASHHADLRRKTA